MNWKAKVMKDDVDKGMFMVVFSHPKRGIRIPLRNVSRLEAECAVASLKYAWQFGAFEAVNEIRSLGLNIDTSVEAE
jgi:hypothetical protein